MTDVRAPGWGADWLVGWLASLGAITLVPDWKLSWTDEPVPIAKLAGPASLEEAGEAIAAAIPSPAAVARMAIAKNHPEGGSEFGRTVARQTFRERAAVARASQDWSLEMSVTDLAPDESGALRHAPLDPPAPRGETLHDRVSRLTAQVDAVGGATIARSLRGLLPRTKGNGLGFDARRLLSRTPSEAEVWTEPVAELLAFYGLRWFPVRGSRQAVQRGWRGAPMSRGAFAWPVWSSPMDCWAVDALLDEVFAQPRVGTRVPTRLRRWSVTGLYTSIAQQPRGSSDVNRGFASQRAW